MEREKNREKPRAGRGQETKWEISNYVSASVLAGGCVCSVYWLVCGNPRWLGSWDFVGHPEWPEEVRLLKNLRVLFFCASACVFLTNAALEKNPFRWAVPEDEGLVGSNRNPS